MPLKQVPPDEFLTHLGISVYHAYNDGMQDDPMRYWYVTDINEDDEFEFDIRDLDPPDSSPEDDHKKIIKHAIQEKKLKLPENINYTH